MSTTPYIPFQPAWQIKAGPLTTSGQGLLSVPLKERFSIESFTLLLGSHTVQVMPKRGGIWLDSQQVLQLPHAAELIWARTMQKELQAGGDNNSAAFDCLFYKIGLKDSDGKSHGWRLYSDGRMLNGIP